jgi:hypothetical protein
MTADDRCCYCRYYLGRNAYEGWCARVAPGQRVWAENAACSLFVDRDARVASRGAGRLPREAQKWRTAG